MLSDEQKKQTIEMLKTLEYVKRQWHKALKEGTGVVAIVPPKQLRSMMSSIISRP